MDKSKKTVNMMMVRNIPEQVRKAFALACKINEVTTGRVLTQVMDELSDPDRLKHYLEDGD